MVQGLSKLRRGRGIQTRAKRARLRRTQPRYAGFAIRSAFKQKPRIPRPTQPYLGSDINLQELLG